MEITKTKEKTLKSLHSKLKNERSYRKRLLKLMKLDKTSILGLKVHHLSSRYIGLFKTTLCESNDIPSEVRIRRTCIELLADLTNRKKKTIERGLTAFLERTYLLENSREYSRDWMIFTSKQQEKTRIKKKRNPRKRQRSLRIVTQKKPKPNSDRTKLVPISKVKNTQTQRQSKRQGPSIKPITEIRQQQQEQQQEQQQKQKKQLENNLNLSTINFYPFQQAQQRETKPNHISATNSLKTIRDPLEKRVFHLQEQKETEKGFFLQQSQQQSMKIDSTSPNEKFELKTKHLGCDENSEHQTLFYQMLFPSEPSWIGGSDLDTSFNKFFYDNTYDNTYQCFNSTRLSKSHLLNCNIEHFV
ncbi:kruppel-like factor 4 [Anaeramoeba flamelloides]|uniref:Kruppel-like factor 4 n=1 Tax=Anaeramoeba flamelloides TaxID=1746091 RepID=A0ABQ8YPQ7_9EUKA|nr:kruppel-like factor 4 [Anaeramoeba flamelloides]